MWRGLCVWHSMANSIKLFIISGFGDKEFKVDKVYRGYFAQHLMGCLKKEQHFFNAT